MEKEMKAAFLKNHGDANQLKIESGPLPKFSANEALVRVQAAALNHVDLWVRKGSPAYPVQLPHILGSDGAGIIENLGTEVKNFKVGDRVVIFPGLSCGKCEYCLAGLDNQCDQFEILGTKRHGTYASYVSVPAASLIKIPESISFDVAASLPVAYTTAWHMLRTLGKLKNTDSILVTGAGSGVGIAAIQIGKSFGCSVIAATTHIEKSAHIKNAGADHIVDLKKTDSLSNEVLKWTNGKGVNIAIEPVGPATFGESLKSLKRYGRLLTCGVTTGPKAELELRTVFGKSLTIAGARLGTKKDFKDLCAAVFKGEFIPLINKSYPLNQVTEAHLYLESAAHTGKIILTIN